VGAYAVTTNSRPVRNVTARGSVMEHARPGGFSELAFLQ